MDGLSVREAGPDDAPTLAGLLHRMAEHYREDLSEPSSVTAERIVRLGIGPDRPVQALIAERDGAPLGAAFFNVVYPAAKALPSLYLKDLFVDPAARQGGIGRALMRRLAALAYERGYDRLDWSTGTANAAAIALYESIGAELVEIKRFYRLDRDALLLVAGTGSAAGD